MKDPTVEGRLAKWFATHFGVISRSEALALGLTVGQIQAKLDTRLWIRMHRSVYRLAGSPAGPHTYLRAAVLAAGEGSLVSHRTAAWLWGMQDAPPRRLEVTIPYTGKLRLAGVRPIRRRRIPTPVECKGLPCTSPIQTLMDCAAITTPVDLDALIDQAVSRKVLKVAELEPACADPSFRNHRGRQRFTQRLAARGVTGSPSPSVLESRAARLFKRHGLPVPMAEVEWSSDRRRYRLDFAYPHIRLVIEVDGWASHMSPEKQRYDNTRSNALNVEGWTVLHFDWWQVTYEGDKVAAQIRDAYHRLAAA